MIARIFLAPSLRATCSRCQPSTSSAFLIVLRRIKGDWTSALYTPPALFIHRRMFCMRSLSLFTVSLLRLNLLRIFIGRSRSSHGQFSSFSPSNIAAASSDRSNNPVCFTAVPSQRSAGFRPSRRRRVPAGTARSHAWHRPAACADAWGCCRRSRSRATDSPAETPGRGRLHR